MTKLKYKMLQEILKMISKEDTTQMEKERR
jgi:hypothetical protein